MSRNRILAMILVGLMVFQGTPVHAFEGDSLGEQILVSEKHTSTYWTVSFRAGEKDIPELYVQDGAKIGPLPEAPSEENMIFAGWFAEGEQITENTVILSDLTVTAVYLSAEEITILEPASDLSENGEGLYVDPVTDSDFDDENAEYLDPETHEIGKPLAILQAEKVNVSVLYGSIPDEVEFNQYTQDETDELVAKYVLSGARSRSSGTNTGYTAFDVSMLQAEGGVYVGDGLYTVSVDLDIPLQDLVPAGAQISQVDYTLYHIHDDAAEKLDVSVDGRTVSFTTESFSPFVLEYTVDFHWIVNGKSYESSIPGGGFISLEHLIELLGIDNLMTDAQTPTDSEEKSGNSQDTEATAGSVTGAYDEAIHLHQIEVSEETKQFVANVVGVAFSKPGLVWVGKADADSTVGGLKEANGLECVYSAELTEEQISEINVQTIEAGDWVLISLLPFISEESLSITMSNGDIWTVRMTDGQIKKTLITASGETFEITVTYGDEAGIPEGAELDAHELTEGELYEEYRVKAAEFMNAGSLGFYRLFDIQIVSQGEKVEPNAPVSVRIEYIDGNQPEAEEDIQVIHFTETDPEILSAEATIVPEGYMEIQFSTVSFSAFATVTDIVDEANILAYLSFENSTADESKNHASVTVNGNPVYETGISGKALYMNGSGNGWLQLSNSYGGSLLGNTSTATVSYWAKPTRTGTSWAYYSAPNGNAQTNGQEYYIGSFTNNSVLHAERFCNGRVNGTASATVDQDHWDFYTIVYENDRTTVYINGEQKNTQAGQQSLQSILGSNSVFQVGKANWNSGEYFQGYIDEFSVFNTALSISEVRSLYEEAYEKTLTHWATRISVTDLVEKYSQQNPIQNVIVYTRVWNASKNSYDYYAVAADGSLVSVYDVSDTIGWRKDADLEWKLTVYAPEGEPNGYFELQNSAGKYLAPQLSNSSTILRDNALGLRFEGWENGTTGTTIEGWDTTAYAYSGLKIENGRLVAAGDNESIEFFFATTDTPHEIGKLETVSTVDTRDTIKITMYDFPSREMMKNIMGTDAYSAGHTAQFGLVQNLLANDTKIPQLFNDYYKVRENVSHLFLQGVYDESGYYYYNASDNYAYLPDGSNDYIVYKQTATYLNEAGGTAEQHGNFFPYNPLTADVVSLLRELYDIGDVPLTEDDPRYGEFMYLASNINYYFGMKLDTDFIFPKDGKDKNGNAVVYEFAGDDDLWVYIDDVLVLDIGGIHGSLTGSINFETGEVHVYSNNSQSNYPNALSHKDTTIRAMFKEAGYSEEWLNEHFDGDTFKDYSTHNMKMFYMERGANASNLRIRFNLPVVEKGSFTVSKELDEGQTDYANVAFSYYAYYMDNGREVPIVPNYTDSSAMCTGAYYVNADGTTTAERIEVDRNGNFYLKPGQKARFQMADSSISYFVKEVDIDTEKIINVTINGTQAEVSHGEATSTTERIDDRGEVNFVNKPSQDLLNKLYITKQLETDVEDPLTKFEFYVYLEDTDGNIVPYNRGIYYIMKDGKYYHFENLYPVADAEGTERTAYRSGPYGTISDIPGGFTAVIEDLVAGTHFIVTERVWNNLPIQGSSNYVFIDKTVDAGSVQAIDMVDERYDIDGAITESTNGVSQVVIRNRPIYRLSAKKVWGNSIVGDGDTHGSVAVALYEKAADGSLTLVENSLKYIVAPSTTVDYFIPNENLEDYVVREVSVSGTDEDPVLTPVEVGGKIVIEDETVDGEKVDDIYIVDYAVGEKSVKFESYYSDGENKTYYVESTGSGKDTNVTHELTVREDTITNVMPRLSISKTDPDDAMLEGAVFTLYREDKSTPVPGYESIVSTSGTATQDGTEEGADSTDQQAGATVANLLDKIFLPKGTYYLAETSAPAGYTLLESMIKITVDENNQAVYALQSDMESSPEIYENVTEDDVMQYTFTVQNHPGAELPATGGPGTGMLYIMGIVLITLSATGFIMKRSRRKTV